MESVHYKISLTQFYFAVRNGTKRGHAVAFGYDESEGLVENGNNMHLPEGTECVVIDSDGYG